MQPRHRRISPTPPSPRAAVSATSEVSDRRRPRYPLHLRVELDRGTGVTRNVGVGGVYFVIKGSRFQVGEVLDFTLVLDELETPLSWRLRCTGSVVRVEPRGEIVGVAATIDAFALDS
jgi:hypothetical protein